MVSVNLLLMALLVMLTSCHRQDCKECGMIEVSSPQVFTRERLIEDRWREIQWLNQKLATPFESTLQGMVDQRLTTQFSMLVEVEAEPQRIRTNETPARDGIAGNRQDDLKQSPAPVGQRSAERPIQLTGLEKMTDEKAFRDGIAALLREKQLNDTHDLRGNTLYELKFDISLFPLDGVKQYAVVTLTILPPTKMDPGTLNTSYEQFLDALNRELAKEALWLQERLLNNTLAEETWVQVRDALKSKEIDLKGCSQSKSQDALELQKQLACYVRHKYLEKFKDLASISVPELIITNKEPIFVSHVTKSDRALTPSGDEPFPDNTPFGRAAFSNEGVRVATVEPKEYVQNISDVAARENLKNLALALSARLPHGISPKVYAQSIERSQQIMQSILRNPLLVAFNNRREFGWLLGPKFTIENASAEFIHSPVRHSVTATIEVPGWYPLVCLGGNFSWLDRQSGRSQEWPLWKGKGKEPCKEGQLRVDLVPDSSSLILSIMNNPRDRSLVKPRIDTHRIQVSQSLHPVVKTPHHSFLIRGANLWRNPAVFIGSAKATYVEILPNMEGLLAYFSEADIQAQRDKGSVDLTVVTTFGSDMVPITLPVTLNASTGLN